jgi:rhodanese-related sulfurtransferase
MPKIVNRDEVKQALDDGSAVLVEALPRDYYDKEHLPGAINIPHDQVDELAASLLPDKDAAVIVYCANGPCANSGIAARRLSELGYTNVADYHLGKEDWFTAGLPLESTSHASA